jgi:hypothetical protein
MKSKNEKSASDKNKRSPQPEKGTNKKHDAVNIDKNSATGNVKPRAGRGLANEGTNVSYDEEA